MDLAFGCGHQVCFSCGELLEKCPICREMVSARVKLIDSAHENQNCPNCLMNPKDMVFGCGHQACYECGEDLQTCPTTTCASLIVTKIKLY
ncbi:E3 ubiquitin-protein ligase RGLG2-like [Humulus lupulus]|uniref:E3 ubiquitin-protein ligase RGLG2-like n=1 Tax=Humulus lupulus TaxID=3486 RepID=UPI002B417C01|nr:E3 ubiquitin-protein ligase RGLG2-like [Humulus lupulus]XP_062104601.1 E3 ubiquitin-protein ligase RGLG2-like [Humulus lupulus]XP_062104602.1 E3 ubiquitin-protein ligase RGLG2-like [Humulus lupulus]